jgi:hypothetical protein
LVDGAVRFYPVPSLEGALAEAKVHAGLDSHLWKPIGSLPVTPHPTAVYEDGRRVWSSEIKWFAAVLGTEDTE